MKRHIAKCVVLFYKFHCILFRARLVVLTSKVEVAFIPTKFALSIGHREKQRPFLSLLQIKAFDRGKKALRVRKGANIDCCWSHKREGRDVTLTPT
jgi:hypothetical protein